MKSLLVFLLFSTTLSSQVYANSCKDMFTNEKPLMYVGAKASEIIDSLERLLYVSPSSLSKESHELVTRVLEEGAGLYIVKISDGHKPTKRRGKSESDQIVDFIIENSNTLDLIDGFSLKPIKSPREGNLLLSLLKKSGLSSQHPIFKLTGAALVSAESRITIKIPKFEIVQTPKSEKVFYGSGEELLYFGRNEIESMKSYLDHRSQPADTGFDAMGRPVRMPPAESEAIHGLAKTRPVERTNPNFDEFGQPKRLPPIGPEE